MFEYKFIEVSLKQIVVPPADNAGTYFPYCYQIIFEKETV